MAQKSPIKIEKDFDSDNGHPGVQGEIEISDNEDLPEAEVAQRNLER